MCDCIWKVELFHMQHENALMHGGRFYTSSFYIQFLVFYVTNYNSIRKVTYKFTKILCIFFSKLEN